MQRVQRLLDGRIIREITPIFDTRALGYSSMLVAAKVDAGVPAPRRARSSTRTRASRTTTCATTTSTCGSRSPPSPAPSSGCSGTLEVLAEPHRRRVDPRAADAEAVQDPHGPRDGEGHRRAVDRRRGGRAAGARADRALRRGRRDDPRDPGPDAGRRRALRARPPSGSASRQDEVLARLRVAARARRPAPRGGDPLPPPRGLLRQRHGRLEGAGGPGARDRARGWPPSAASRTATSGRPTPTGRTRSSRWPTAARRRSATRSSTRSPRRPGIEERATLYSSTEFKKVRMLYFTDDFRALGGGAQLTTSLTDTRSAELYRRALHVLPGGVNSPVRAMRSIGRDPIFIERAAGAEHHRRRRQHLRRLRLLVGPADPRPRAPGRARGDRRGGGARDDVRRRRRPARSSWPSSSRAHARRRHAADDLLGHRGVDERDPRSRAPRPAATSCSSSPAPTTATSTGCSPRRAPAWPRRASPPPRACPRRPPPPRSSCRGTTPTPCAPRSPSTSSPRSCASPTRPTWASSRRPPGFLELLRELAHGARRAARLRRGDHAASASPTAARRSCAACCPT